MEVLVTGGAMQNSILRPPAFKAGALTDRANHLSYGYHSIVIEIHKARPLATPGYSIGL